MSWAAPFVRPGVDRTKGFYYYGKKVTTACLGVPYSYLSKMGSRCDHRG
jgi:hypothetical protein